jgi:multidrug resistance efflux pump
MSDTYTRNNGHFPTIVCLCGSTRFSEAFREANLRETLAGRIVLTIGCDMRSDADLFADKSEDELAQIKSDLDELHLCKIDLANEVLILNVDGYVGQSTRRELTYARMLGKTIRWLEPDKAI